MLKIKEWRENKTKKYKDKKLDKWGKGEKWKLGDKDDQGSKQAEEFNPRTLKQFLTHQNWKSFYSIYIFLSVS